MRVAVIADIHGNVLALQAVLADIAHQSADLVVDLGDCVSGPLWPRETFEILAERRFPTVRGNHERQLQDLRADMGLSDGYTYDRLKPTDVAHLGALPLTFSPDPKLLMCHGTPQDDATPLLDAPLPGGGFALAAPAEIVARLGALATDPATKISLVLCGHSHQPRVASVLRAKGKPLLIVNPGSVGLPAFEDGGKFFNTGTPHARYALLIAANAHDAWTIDLRAITYDWHRAAKQAADNNRPDWASGLATGFAG